MPGYTIGVDIGTTGTKTVLLDTERGIVAQAGREATLHSDRPGFAEADPRQWLDNTIGSIREVVASSGVHPREVAAIATTGMVPAVVPVDSSGRPVGRGILQNDARATDEIAAIAGELAGLDVVAVTGSPLTQQSVAPTVAWLRGHQPERWQRTTRIVGSYDYVLSALGAEPHVERNWALESGLFTIAGDWFAPAADAAALPATMVPPPREPGADVGHLSPEAADATGLSPRTRLIVGGADHVLSAFAAGVAADGDWLVKLGGAGDILAASSTPVVDPRLYLDAHPVPGLWLPNGCMATSGSLIRWFQAITGGVDLARLDAEAEHRSAAEVLCLPYFLGEKSPLHDPELRGAFVGMHLGHDRADLYRAVLEGIAFGFRHNAEVLKDAGVQLDRATVTNGGSTSRLWKSIHASILGVELRTVLEHPGASLGAAVVAGIGAGALPGWESVARFVKEGVPVPPEPALAERYSDAYARWRELGDALAPTSRGLARRDV